MFRIKETGGYRRRDQAQDGQSGHRGVGKRHGCVLSYCYSSCAPQPFMLQVLTRFVLFAYTRSRVDDGYASASSMEKNRATLEVLELKLGTLAGTIKLMLWETHTKMH